MPELPEVETVVRALRQTIGTARIDRVAYASRRISRHNNRDWRLRVVGQRIQEYSRRGKYMVIALNDRSHLLIHLRMSGRLRVLKPGTHRPRYTRLVLEMTGGELTSPRLLALVDTRQFAHIDWSAPGQLPSHAGLSRLGTDAMTLAPREFVTIVGRTNRPIKTLLMDQSQIAGLGNIYVDESLFASRIHPLTRSSLLEEEAVIRLCKEIQRTLSAAIRACGTTFDTFSDLAGRSGGFAPKLNVYHRTSQSCKVCRTLISRIVVAGRGTHFCSKCQPLQG